MNDTLFALTQSVHQIQATLALIAIAVFAIAWRHVVLAKALREQAQLTREAFKSIAYVVEQLNAPPAERVRMYERNLERIEELLTGGELEALKEAQQQMRAAATQTPLVFCACGHVEERHEFGRWRCHDCDCRRVET